MKDQVSLRFPLRTGSLAGRMSVSLHIAELRDGMSDEPDVEAAETGQKRPVIQIKILPLFRINLGSAFVHFTGLAVCNL